MNIFVTGGFGFIGSNFINYILNKPEVDVIVNTDCLTYAANKNNLPIHSKIKNYDINIRDRIAMYSLFNEFKISHVVHFAAESHVDNSISKPEKFLNTNIGGTFSLLEATKSYKKLKRFHHVSTDEVYGSLSKSDPKFTEITPYDPRSPYSATKAASDHLVRAYHHTYNLPVTISNCSNNYGPNQHTEKLIPKIISNIYKKEKVPIYGKGDNIRDWLYVDDHCEAIWEILTRGSDGETYNIGGDCEKTNNEILEDICRLMQVSVDDYRVYVEDRKGHDFRYAIDFSKIKNELGWSPRFSFDEGILNTIKFYTNSK